MSDQGTPAYRSYDGWYTYSTSLEGEGRCYLQVYEPRGGIPVVIVTEAPDNPGTSVTKATEALATQIWRELLPHAREGFRLVEVYLDPARPDLGGAERMAAKVSLVSVMMSRAHDKAETLFEVSYTLDGERLTHARYKLTTRAQVEALIGGPFSVPFTRSY